MMAMTTSNSTRVKAHLADSWECLAELNMNHLRNNDHVPLQSNFPGVELCK